jgi:hypothetical protein
MYLFGTDESLLGGFALLGTFLTVVFAWMGYLFLGRA